MGSPGTETSAPSQAAVTAGGIGVALMLLAGAAEAQDPAFPYAGMSPRARALVDLGTAGMISLLFGGAFFVLVGWGRKQQRAEPLHLAAFYAWTGLALLAGDPRFAAVFPMHAASASALRHAAWCFAAGSALLYTQVAAGARPVPPRLAAGVAMLVALLGVFVPDPHGAGLRELALLSAPLVPLASAAIWAPRAWGRKPGAGWLFAAAALGAIPVAGYAGWAPASWVSPAVAMALMPLIAASLIVGTGRRVVAYGEQRRIRMEMARDGVLVVTPDLVVAEANAAALRLLAPAGGLEAPFALSRVLAPEDLAALRAHVPADAAAPPSGSPPPPAQDPDGLIDLRVSGADGAPRVLEANATRLPHGDHLLLVRDVTERRRLEGRSAQSERLEAIGLLAGGIAHDFNNLLQGVLGTASDLRGRRNLPPDVERGLARIERAAGRAAVLTSQLLAFARGGRFEPRPVVVSALVEEAAWLVRDGRRGGADIRLDLAPGLPPVAADAAQIEQVFDNLIRNAVQAMEGRPGAVDVRAFPVLIEAEDAARFRIAPGPHVRVVVRDRGPGIAPEVLPHIFEPFVTTRAPGKGTGLGLAVAHGVVERHGGSLRVASTPGEGATFTVDLPVALGELARVPDLMAAAAEARGRQEGDGGGEAGAPPVHRPRIAPRTVLFVDDEDVLRTFVKDALSVRGYDVTTAASGEQALRLLSDPELIPRIDVLVVDLRMPGLDGLEVLEAVRATHPGVPAVLCSGHGSTERIEAFVSLPHSAFLPKPFRVEALESAIAEAISDGRTGAAHASRATA
ncbi:ATP-binding protein [Myxococcota bacterium]|nr:ATP-binding protein [Myxococcota bacterium]